MNRKQRRSAGNRTHLSPALSKAKTPDQLYEAGLSHMRAGRHLDAHVSCERALAADSGHAGSLHLMGQLSLHAKQYAAAVEWIARAIRRDPKPEYISSLGMALQQQGRHEEALKAFDKAVQIKPDQPELWANLGDALAEMKRPAEAMLAYQHVLELDPRNWGAAYRCGVIFYESGGFEEALPWFNRCAELRPDDIQALHMRATTLRGLKRFEECLADNMQLHKLDPAQPLHCNNIGDALLWLGRREEALKWFNKALELQPDDVDALLNKAVWFRQHHRFKESAEIYERLRLLHPNNAKFERDLAYVHLLMGNFEAGWSGREARWKVPGLPIIYPNFSQPMWLGDEDIAGKTVLIYADEGLGDAIQFARYVPMVAARGARVILVLQDALHPLFSGMLGVQECRTYSSSSPPPAFDMYCPMGSLPLAFGTRLESVPRATYLPPISSERVQAWETRLSHRDRLRVGLVWSGSPKHGNDRDRSIPLRTMARLFDVGATFLSLQKDLRPDDEAFLSERTDIVDMTTDLTAFAETAALISCLDLVITVDTSVAHLAATLGRPTWVLLPYLPDWRWLLDRDDSPWYPTVRLFRQNATREYASVLDRVRAELLAEVSMFRAEDKLAESCAVGA
jgi:tetratricopeptide (TPR) repeat protein